MEAELFCTHGIYLYVAGVPLSFYLFTIPTLTEDVWAGENTLGTLSPVTYLLVNTVSKPVYPKYISYIYLHCLSVMKHIFFIPCLPHLSYFLVTSEFR